MMTEVTANPTAQKIISIEDFAIHDIEYRMIAWRYVDYSCVYDVHLTIFTIFLMKCAIVFNMKASVAKRAGF